MGKRGKTKLQDVLEVGKHVLRARRKGLRKGVKVLIISTFVALCKLAILLMITHHNASPVVFTFGSVWHVSVCSGSEEIH